MIEAAPNKRPSSAEKEKEKYREDYDAFLSFAHFLRQHDLSIQMERRDNCDHRVEESIIESSPECTIIDAKTKRKTKFPPVYYAYKRITHFKQEALDTHRITFNHYKKLVQSWYRSMVKLHYLKENSRPSRWVMITEDYQHNCFAALWEHMNDPYAILKLVVAIRNALRQFNEIYCKKIYEISGKEIYGKNGHLYSLSDFKIIMIGGQVFVKFDWTSVFPENTKNVNCYHRALYVLALTASVKDTAPTNFKEMKQKEEGFEKIFNDFMETKQEARKPKIILTRIERQQPNPKTLMSKMEEQKEYPQKYLESKDEEKKGMNALISVGNETVPIVSPKYVPPLVPPKYAPPPRVDEYRDKYHKSCERLASYVNELLKEALKTD